MLSWSSNEVALVKSYCAALLTIIIIIIIMIIIITSSNPRLYIVRRLGSTAKVRLVQQHLFGAMATEHIDSVYLLCDCNGSECECNDSV